MVALKDEAVPDLRPNFAILIVGAISIGVVCATTLPWPAAMVSTALGMLMISGAEIDARTMLLPDPITLGATVCGIAAAPVVGATAPLLAIEASVERAALTALAVALLRWCYGALRRREGIGWGDVKLAAAIGAWLPLGAVPMCFALATGSALLAIGFAWFRGRMPDGAIKIPFGAFLCPALWLSSYAQLLLT